MLRYQDTATSRSAEVPAIVGEDPSTESPVDAARWVRIYSELIGLHEDQLRSGPSGASTRRVERILDELRSRLDEWQARHLELAGMEFDPYARTLTIAGRPYTLTRREAQLLDFLLEHPGQFFTSEVLTQEAWSDAKLHPEQVRTYIVRLRRKLEDSSASARIVNRQRLGYALSVERGGPPASRRPAS